MLQDAGTKKRKATYLRRKEEHDALQDQIQEIERQLTELRAKNDGGVTQLQELIAAVGLNTTMKNAVEQQQLKVAMAQSSVSQWLQNQVDGETGDALEHEGRETRSRVSLRDGVVPAFGRAQATPFGGEIEDADGNFCCVHNEVIPFPGVQSMRKVFDAVKFTLDTLEISISEQLGHITVRDDYDVVGADSFICNYRLASGIDSGVTTELNAWIRTIYIRIIRTNACERRNDSPDKSVKEVSKKESPAEVEDRLEDTDGEIVMMRNFFVKTCRPEFEVSEIVTQELRDNITWWGDVVLQAIKRIIYA
ncbi:hypothetical protein JG687_00008096 [Phytophthora cactorum]|uniref:Uncharacterized protein n=1 Tax=Phytophthora cactorum TaxID=29920 RepID=A0A8T1UIH6_9STRA|nr:hypothetical protein JG687_00008096 [Phytophthora cactorum]